MGLGDVLPPHTQQDLPNVNARGHANGLAVRMAHAAGEAIGPGAREHLVLADDVEGVNAHPDVVLCVFLPKN